MELPIVFEDDYLVVINKPFGVVVNRADTTANFETVQDYFEEKFKLKDLVFSNPTEIQKEFLSRSGIVHRLDKDTSGVLVVAKTPEVFENLKNQFKERMTVKRYLTLVHGKVQSKVGIIDAPIERSPFNRMQFGVFPGGREAQTKYKISQSYELKTRDQGQNIVTLLEVEPKTGRTHQIRVHMKYIGHAVVSDPIYGGRKQIREDLTWCPRLFLHAASLTFNHPAKKGEPITFEAPIPSDLTDVLTKLEKIDSI